MKALLLSSLLCLVCNTALCAKETVMEKYVTDTYTLESGKKVSFTFFGHASFMIDYNGEKIYIDPVGEYADYSKQDKADIILITHGHYDHFDDGAVCTLKKEDTEVLSTSEVVQTAGYGTVLKNYDTIYIKGITVHAFPAYNTTEGRDKFHPKGRDNGYLLEIEQMRIYISGDTETVDDNESINNCDVLFLAVNQPYTMTIEQAVSTAQRINPRVFYPYHTTDTDIRELENSCMQHGIPVVIHVMR